MDGRPAEAFPADETALANIVASRICHDLISPVGAIGNGMELLRTAGDGGADEMTLITECAETASATLQFLRIAFGARSDDEAVAVNELSNVANAYFRPRRVVLDWGGASSEALLFGPAKILLLLAMVGASSTPFGGTLTLSEASAEPFRLAWRVTADRIKPQARMEQLFARRPAIGDIAPGDAHVMLLWNHAERRGVRPFWRQDEEGALIGVA